MYVFRWGRVVFPGAVAWAAEGHALRKAGVRTPILVLGHSYSSDAAAAVANDLTLTCHSEALGAALSQEAQVQGKTALVHLKVDTGLHRFGVSLEEATRLAEALRGLPRLTVEGLSTHMANADEGDDSFSVEQAAVFDEALRRMPWVPFRHVANSATAFRRSELRYSGVRCGLSLYGVTPQNTLIPGLTPVLSLRARVARISQIEEGDGVSYGLAWRAGRRSVLALVPVGYADGWPRALSGRVAVLIGGTWWPAVGRIAMDQFIVDVTGGPEMAEGDVVTLIGDDGGERLGAGDVADLCGSIPWEIMAGLGQRLPRVFHRRGYVEDVFCD